MGYMEASVIPPHLRLVEQQCRGHSMLTGNREGI